MQHDLDIKRILKQAVYEDKEFFLYIISYAIIIAIIELSMPISIQLLINSVANTALFQPIIIIGIILFFLLGFSAMLRLMQKHLLEIYKQNSFVRLSSSMFVKSIYTDYDEFKKHNVGDLSSHYFEIFNIQSSASTLVVEGFISLLQILLCFTLASIYHPYFIVMNIIAIFVIWLSWAVFKKRAIILSVERSESKYMVFRWLNEIFSFNSKFKSKDVKQYALNKAYNLINDYIIKRKKYWKISFSQLTILTMLYVFLAITLFVVGSLLVIKGQLSLGQLVAAEILYSIALFGSSKLSSYFDLYYSLIASADELDHMFSTPNENNTFDNQTNAKPNINSPYIFELSNVSYTDFINHVHKFNFKIKPNSNNLLISDYEHTRSIVIELLSAITKPHAGQISFYGQNYNDYHAHTLRNYIYVINTPDIFSCSIYEYLSYGYNNVLNTDIDFAMQIVGLDSCIKALPDGINTTLINNGIPLHRNDIVQLKIARAILHKPPVIIITDILFLLQNDLRMRILKYFDTCDNLTLIHISNTNSELIKCDHIINLDSVKNITL